GHQQGPAAVAGVELGQRFGQPCRPGPVHLSEPLLRLLPAAVDAERGDHQRCSLEPRSDPLPYRDVLVRLVPVRLPEPDPERRLPEPYFDPAQGNEQPEPNRVFPVIPVPLTVPPDDVRYVADFDRVLIWLR